MFKIIKTINDWFSELTVYDQFGIITLVFFIFPFVFQVILVILKILQLISLSWFTVLLPIEILLLLFLFVMLEDFFKHKP